MKTVQRLQGQIDFQNNKMKALRRTIDDGVRNDFDIFPFSLNDMIISIDM